jgi:hypothetical protein
LETARQLVREATFEDFLEFLTVREIAGSSATAQFYKAFPRGKSQLLEVLKNEAAPPEIGSSTPVSSETLLELMQLVSDLKDRKPEAIDGLRDVALKDFDGYFGSGENGAGDVNDILCNLMAAAAREDPEAKDQLKSFYAELTKEYVAVYTPLLAAVDREPIEELESIERFAIVITALFDGLAMRERMGDPAKEVLAAALLPIVSALTVEKDSASPSDAELLYSADG